MTKVTRDTLLDKLAAPDPEVLRLLDDADEVTERILAAAFEQMAVVGWRRSTVEDVAKRAGLGRATVYRKFPSKNALTEAVLLAELRKYLAGSTAATSDQPTVADRMAESCAYTVEFLRDHPLLRRLLETEPDAILPSLTVGAGPIVDMFREFCVTLWQHEFYRDTTISDEELRHLRTVAELHIRITLSLILTKPSAIELDTAEQARIFARHYLVPMLDAK
ncbi:TetR/AcrR family transcriptional regulator [Nocardia altamirensis]|uniref:TetR/AcrR family transcriptional regulator n=1 Tax=Nocardia TaxID=1817 RepID=UPI00083FFF77|nr:TetR/AcrR family transcriptional regulator [Nocardia altamirensis]